MKNNIREKKEKKETRKIKIKDNKPEIILHINLIIMSVNNI